MSCCQRIFELLKRYYVDENFHARYSATGKTYVYKWSYAKVHSPFERNYSVHLERWRPDVEKMKKAAAYLIGTHDFTSFCSSKTATSNRVRTIRLLTLEKSDDELIMTIEGDGFLYNMVRTIAGMLLAVGWVGIPLKTSRKFLNYGIEKKPVKPHQHTVCTWKV